MWFFGVLEINIKRQYQPYTIEGNSIVDDRGMVSFINAFSFKGVKRFYQVVNHQAGFVRAWHAHKKEAKYVYVSSGSAIVAAVKIDNWTSPSTDIPIYRFVLSSHKPTVLYIPSGYANGFKTLTPDAVLIFLSTLTVEESRGDDIRYDAHLWNPWDIIER